MRSLKFGVEIEFTNDVRRELVEGLRQKGVAVESQSYNHSVQSCWKVVTDASCGYEIVSPVLTNFDDLKKVCETLKEIGAKVNKDCGIHVHHDINDFDAESVKNVYRLYNKFETAIDAMMPPSRRENNNRWCKTFDNNSMLRLERCMTMENLKMELADNSRRSNKRYRKLNFCSYIAYGTLEFRHHSGTVEFEKIQNWVIITNQIIETCKTNKRIKKATDARLAKWQENDRHMMYDFYTQIGISGTEVAKYIGNRKKKFA
jgi:hypothetical protein